MSPANTIQQGTETGALLVFLSNDEAQAVAKLCKRLSRSRVTQYRFADDKDEARTMMAGVDAIRNVLLNAGFGDLRQAPSRRTLASMLKAGEVHTADAGATYEQAAAIDDKTGDLFDQAGRA